MNKFAGGLLAILGWLWFLLPYIAFAAVAFLFFFH